MSKQATSPKIKKSHLVGARTGELAPLVEIWIKKNPGVNTSHLVRRALKHSPDLRALAGKRYAHLIAADSFFSPASK